MADNIFKRSDLRHLTMALMNDATHADMTLFEMDLEIDTDGSKSDRATQIVKYLVQRPDGGAGIISLLNFLYVERPFDPGVSASYSALRKNVLEPRGVRETDDGFAIVGDLAGPSSPSDGNSRASPAVAFAKGNSGEGPAAPPVTGGAWGAPEAFSGAFAPNATTAAAASSALEKSPEIARDPRSVFLVHGRDMRPVQVLEQFLTYLGMHVLTWSQADELTRVSQPRTYDIVRAGIESAGAVIVIFSPDDRAMVHEKFRETGDETEPTGQARQNVTLEAGMAYALSPGRTIFVKSEPTRDISDIAGFNWINLDGRWESRQALRTRLRTAGATVRPGEYDLMRTTAGPFKV